MHRANSGIASRRLRVVEIGAGWGGLASVLGSDGGIEYVGFEPSASRAEFCVANGFDVRAEVFAPGTVERNVDVVVMDNVLEHVEEPGELFRVAVDSLADGGLLVVIVPNLHDVRQVHAGWRYRHHWQPPAHLNYFSARVLKRLFLQNGLSFRFFGFDSFDSRRDRATFVRVMADTIGVHPFGLNCFGIKNAD